MPPARSAGNPSSGNRAIWKPCCPIAESPDCHPMATLASWRLIFSSGLRIRFEERLDELAGRRGAPVTRPRQPSNELPAPVDEIGGGWSPDAVRLPGHVPALIEQDGSDVAPLPDGPPDQFGTFP